MPTGRCRKRRCGIAIALALTYHRNGAKDYL